MLGAHDLHEPLSRTMQYKKVTKPLLERKRRARINRCLDELKDLMVGALEAEGENVSKLEKADILELTVRHLHKLRRSSMDVDDVTRFQAGFSQCASEACHFLLSLPGLDARVGRRLVAHLGQSLSGLLPSPGSSTSPSLDADPASSPWSETADAAAGPSSRSVPVIVDNTARNATPIDDQFPINLNASVNIVPIRDRGAASPMAGCSSSSSPKPVTDASLQTFGSHSFQPVQKGKTADFPPTARQVSSAAFVPPTEPINLRIPVAVKPGARPGPLSIHIGGPARYSPPVSPVSPRLHRPPQQVLSSTPSARDLAQPMAGLLMTVKRGEPSDEEKQSMWRPW